MMKITLKTTSTAKPSSSTLLIILTMPANVCGFTLDHGQTCVITDKGKECVKRYFANLNPKMTIVRHHAEGDGSCFFHSLAIALCKDPNFHSKSKDEQAQIGHALRKEVEDQVDSQWDQIMEKTDRMADFIGRGDEYREKLKDTSEMSDEAIIHFSLRVLQVNAYFYDRRQCQLYCGERGPNDPAYPTVLIMWANDLSLHFEPVVRPVSHHHELEETRIFTTQEGKTFQGNFDYYDPLVEYLRTKYEKEDCLVLH